MVINIFFRADECYGYASTLSVGDNWTLPKMFLLFHGIANLIFHLTLWRSFWKGRSFLQLLQIFLKDRSNQNRTLFPYLSWIVAGFIGLLLTIAHAGFPYIENFTLISTFNSSSKINSVFVVFTVFIRFLRHVVGYIEEFMLSIVIYTVWKSVSNFVNNFSKTVSSAKINYFYWEKVKQDYSTLICITDIANDIIWPNIVGHTIMSFFYYSFNFSTFMASKDYAYRLGFIIYVLNTCYFYYIGADVNSQV